VLHIIIYTPILNLCLAMVVRCVLQGFRPFYSAFDPYWMYFDLHHGHPYAAMLME